MQRLILVDGSGYIFRAYHALPPLTRRSDGLPIGAVAGFCNMLWKLVADSKEHKPTHFAVIFDASAITFRNEMYEGYKADRPTPPDDLRPQFSLIRDAVRAFNLPCIEQSGFEADDIIATYARQAEASGMDVIIVSSDKDLMQLVSDKTCLLDTMKNKTICRAEVIEKFGVPPEKVIEVQALAGDSIDGVPGVPGIGIKTAAQLIEEYGDLETLLSQASGIKQQKRRENLIEFADQARLSKKLVTLDAHVPVTLPLDALTIELPRGPDLVAFCKAMEFTTLTKRVAEALDVEAAQVEPAIVEVKHWPPEGGITQAPTRRAFVPPTEANAPVLPMRQAAQTVSVETVSSAAGFDHARYETVTSFEALDAWIARARAQGRVALDTETSSIDAHSADLVGLSLATDVNVACYIPFVHRGGDGLFDSGFVEGQLPRETVIEKLQPLLNDPAVLKIGQNIKYDLSVLRRFGTDVTPFDDTMLLSYVIEGGSGMRGLDEMAKRFFNHTPISFKDVTAGQKGTKDFALVPLGDATRYAAEDADIALRLWLLLRPQLVAAKLATVYETLERPLVAVLAAMEARGVMVDRKTLSLLSNQFAKTIEMREREIGEVAGGAFNIGSPKQLGEVLFERMKLPGGKKTASGQWATDAGTLEELAAQGERLPAKILEWRQLSKLKSTYTDALPTYINARTGRVHTCFSLAATSTGRLSSSEPNVQNIPIRNEEGRKIRTAFIAAPGNVLISADYSQIELRVLAHMADIPELKAAFARGIDIHAATASEMFGVAVEGMDPMVRRKAKAINFGIVYGISAFGLAAQLGIGREEAGQYIKTYFERFPGIKTYMAATKEKCHQQGYVETLFGRRCAYPNVVTKNPAQRAAVERAAINAPIQGSAADIIRRAMIRMDGALVQAGLTTQMLLQVHDELIFEAPEREVDQALPLIRTVMEKAALPVVDLSVPLVVDARAGLNWDAAH